MSTAQRPTTWHGLLRLSLATTLALGALAACDDLYQLGSGAQMAEAPSAEPATVALTSATPAAPDTPAPVDLGDANAVASDLDYVDLFSADLADGVSAYRTVQDTADAIRPSASPTEDPRSALPRQLAPDVKQRVLEQDRQKREKLRKQLPPQLAPVQDAFRGVRPGMLGNDLGGKTFTIDVSRDFQSDAGKRHRTFHVERMTNSDQVTVWTTITVDVTDGAGAHHVEEKCTRSMNADGSVRQSVDGLIEDTQKGLRKEIAFVKLVTPGGHVTGTGTVSVTANGQSHKSSLVLSDDGIQGAPGKASPQTGN